MMNRGGEMFKLLAERRPMFLLLSILMLVLAVFFAIFVLATAHIGR
jgi:hypothetical protein